MAVFSTLIPAEFEHQHPSLDLEIRQNLELDFVPNIFRRLAKHDIKLANTSWAMVKDTLCTGSLPRVTKEIIFSYIAYRKNCDYCHIAHHAIAIKQGYQGEPISVVFTELEHATPGELSSLLSIVELALNDDFSLMENYYEQLEELGFELAEITEFIGMISCALYMVSLANYLLLEVDDAFIDIIEAAA